MALAENRPIPSPTKPYHDAMPDSSTFLQIEAGAHSGAFGNNSLPTPTDAQCKAGNYKLGRIALHGLSIAIEQPRGTYRTGMNANGKRWSSRMAAHYGYIAGTKGNDGDEVDCFIGYYPQSELAFVINQNVAGCFDEHKLMLCFPDEESARRAYADSYERGWPGLASIVPTSISQLKWWLKNGNMTRPLKPEHLPHEGLEAMTRRTQWNADALPYDQTLDQVLYDIRRSDGGEGLLLDSVSMADILEDSDGAYILDAMVVPKAGLERKMGALQRVMERVAQEVKPVAVQITEPFTQRGVANVAAIFELSDGQTVSVYFHNPDVTPKKMAPTDELISWKFLLNKKDITIVVAPERGQDLNVNEVARRIMKLAEKNSAAFVRANGKRAERMQRLADLNAEIAGLETELKVAQNELEAAKVEAEDRAAQAQKSNDGGGEIPDGKRFDWLKGQIEKSIQLANGARSLGVEFKTPKEYMAAINSGEIQSGDSVQVQKQRLDEEVSQLAGVKSGAISPAKIVGSEGANKRARAISYLEGRILELELSLKHDGLWSSTNMSYYNEYLERTIKEFSIARAQAQPAEIDPTTPAGYAQVMADPALQDKHQDDLDDLFQDRIIATRNALRDLGWGGKEYAWPMTKGGYALEAAIKHAGAGKNVVGTTYKVKPVAGGADFGIADDLTKTPAELAAQIDAAATRASTLRSSDPREDARRAAAEIQRELSARISKITTILVDAGMTGVSGEDRFTKGGVSVFYRVGDIDIQQRLGMELKPFLRFTVKSVGSAAEDVEDSLDVLPQVTADRVLAYVNALIPVAVPTEPDLITTVDAAYQFTDATDAFKREVADSVDKAEYSTFATAKAMDLKAKTLGLSIAWDVGQAMLDSASAEGDEDEDDFDEEDEWDATPEDEGDEVEPILDGDFKGHPFRGNQHKKAGYSSRVAVNSSIKAKRAERSGDAAEAAKAHKDAHDIHRAAAVFATGNTKKYHKKMAKFHERRASAGVMDSALLDAAGAVKTIIGKIKRASKVIGRAMIGGDGKAMVYVGTSGTERVTDAAGQSATWSDDDAADMLDYLVASLAPAKDGAMPISKRNKLIDDFQERQNLLGEGVKAIRKIFNEMADAKREGKDVSTMATAGFAKAGDLLTSGQVTQAQYDEFSALYSEVSGVAATVLAPAPTPTEDLQIKSIQKVAGTNRRSYTSAFGGPGDVVDYLVEFNDGRYPVTVTAREGNKLLATEFAQKERARLAAQRARLLQENQQKEESQPDANIGRKWNARYGVTEIIERKGDRYYTMVDGKTGGAPIILASELESYISLDERKAAEHEQWLKEVAEKEAAEAAEKQAKDADTTYLQSLIDGTTDMFAPDIFERLEPMFAKYENDAAMMAMLERAAQAYGDSAVKAAQAALATA